MKPSKFNYFFEVDGQTILAYNSFTTALVKLEEEEFGHLQDFCTEPKEDFFETRNLLPFRDQLEEVGLIVPQEVDELEQIRALRAAVQQEERHLGLTILPTLNCNFQCCYCFSYARQERLSHTVRQALLHFVKQKLDKVENLSISWFGGEPLLCLDVIEDLSAQFKVMGEERQVKITPGAIITNGYLLTREVAGRLQKAGISSAQVTLDGDQETHDRRRPLRGGQGTFQRILDNLTSTSDLLEIQVRINLDRNNLDGALGALDSLAACGLEQKVHVSFGHVKPYTEACADVAAVCLSPREFSEKELIFTKEALRRGFRSFPYPRLHLGGVCGADKQLAFVVGPDGLLFKCWAEASMGASWSTGSLLQEEPTHGQRDNLQRYLDWNPLADEQCRDCRLLPICMGGCPHQRIRHGVDTDCSTWRYNLLETLALRYKLGDMMQLSKAHSQSDLSPEKIV